MDNVEVVSKTTHQAIQQPWGNVTLNRGSVVKLPVGPSQVASTVRSGQDLVITLHSGERLVIRDFFVTDTAGQANDLVLQDENNTAWNAEYDHTAFDGFDYTAVGSTDSSLAGGTLGLASSSEAAGTGGLAGAVAGLPGWALAALSVAGVGGAVAVASNYHGGGGSHDDSSPDNALPPGEGIPPDNPSTPGEGSPGEGSTPPDGSQPPDGTSPPEEGSPPGSPTNPDTTAPDAATAVQFAKDGRSLSGQGEPLARVTVTDLQGNLLGTAQVDATGHFTVALGTALLNGEKVLVSLSDAAGNVSVPLSVTAFDFTPPGPVTELLQGTDGISLSGSGEAGASVVVKSANGVVIGNGTVGTDGHFLLTLARFPAVGELLSITQTDAAGNVSLPASFAATVPVPTVLSDVAVSADGLSVVGHGTPGSTVTVRDSQGQLLVSGEVNAQGRFHVDLPDAQLNGETLQVAQLNVEGVVTSTLVVTAPDLSPPDLAQELAIDALGSMVSGRGEAHAQVLVRLPGGPTLGTGTADANGMFAIPLEPSLQNGEELHVIQADVAGNNSGPASLMAPDLYAETPGSLTLDATGRVLSGQGEVGATVEVRGVDGTLLGSGTVGQDGQFSVSLFPAQLNGESLQVVQTDLSGNVSLPAVLVAADQTPPLEADNLAVSHDGLRLSGTGEPGAQVSVTAADGTLLGTTTVAPDGQFTVTLSAAQTNGQTLSVTLSDGVNIPTSTTVQASDISAPEAPSRLILSADGATLSGSAEAGAQVSVTGPRGEPLGSVTAGNDGSFQVTLGAAQTNGEVLRVVAVDSAGNVSLPGSVTALDVTPPARVDDLRISADGLMLSGTGEVGATVRVGIDGIAVAVGTVLADGTFQLMLDRAATAADTLAVFQTDAAGNDSPLSLLSGPTGSEPTTPTNLVLGSDGFELTGTAMVGNRIEVRNSQGSVLGTGVVTPDGDFHIILSTPQVNGQTLLVSALNTDGVVSIPARLIAGDTTAPAQVTDLHIDGAGTLLSGKGEPGATVKVLDASGTQVGQSQIGVNGTFGITLDSPQTTGQNLSVIQTDGAGNASSPSALRAPDLAAPDAPSNLAINLGGTVVSGQGEAGTHVVIRDSLGVVIGNGVVNAGGQFQIVLDTAQNNGVTLRVTLVDAAGNVSLPSELVSIDTTPPGTVTNVVLSGDDLTVSGRGEPGATVTVTGPGGGALGHAQVGADGLFTVTLSPPPRNGGSLDVVQTDAAGNASPAVLIAAHDLTAPSVPTGLVSADGTLVHGQGEAGATVRVTDTNGTLLGSATVNPAGDYSVALVPAASNGQALILIQQDMAGNVSPALTLAAPDITPPSSPVGLSLGGQGLVLSGQAEAGSTVRVLAADGTLLGTATAAFNGIFQVTLNTPQINGQTLLVTAADAAGNTSPSASLVALDTQPPAPVSGVVVGYGGTQLVGNGEAGAQVRVEDASGRVLGTTTVDAHGYFSVTLSPAGAPGSSLWVSQADLAGNQSPASRADVPVVPLPDAPTGLSLAADGSWLAGSAAPGLTVTVRTAQGGVLGTAVVNASGSFIVTLATAQANGETLTVVASDASGAQSLPVQVTALDSTAPDSVHDLALDANGLTLTGRGEAGASVTVTGPSGNAVGTAVVDADGRFSVALSTPQTNGQRLSVVQVDAAGNASSQATLLASDRTAPEAPTALSLSTDGVVLSGRGEAGATVSVTDSQGRPLGTGTVNLDGQFHILLTSAQINGESLSVRLADNAGNVSAVASLTAVDATAPAPVTAVSISSDGLILTGHGEPGARVVVTNAQGLSLGSGIVSLAGSFSLSLSPSQTNAERLLVVQTDAAGNASPTVTVIAPDTSAPEALQDVAISASGTVVSGRGEAGATVTVSDASGTLLGSTRVAANGEFQVTLTPAQINNQVLTVVQADPPGNLSPPSQVIAPDLVAPNTATALSLDSAGLVLTGLGEPGARVTVHSLGGIELGHGDVAADGTFRLQLDAAQRNGETLLVTLADRAGNLSAVATLNAADSTPPGPATDLMLDAAGRVLSGHGEAGAAFTVSNAAGVILGRGNVDADGRLSVMLDAPQIGGETLQVLLRDASGNPSSVATLIAPDLTPPSPASGLSLAADGVSLTGTGEADADVEVLSANGARIGLGQVGVDGHFSLTLQTPQLDGQRVTVILSDASHNPSAPAFLSAPDITPPAPVSGVRVDADGTHVSGVGQAGATVRVTGPDGDELGTAIVAADNRFVVTLNAPMRGGELLTLVQTDPGGDSPSLTAEAPDLQAPAAPKDIGLEDGGLWLVGSAEADSIVEVRSASGELLGSGPASAGQFRIELSLAQLNGEVLSVTARDAANNVSSAATYAAADTTPPPPPTLLALSADFVQLAGQGEVGAKVQLLDASNQWVTLGEVADDGTFLVNLPAAASPGELLEVRLLDAAQNSSTSAQLTAPTVAPPEPASGLVLQADGLTLSGQAQAGATIIVTAVNGTVQGTTLVDDNGHFELQLDTPQLNGERLLITVRDGFEQNSLPATLTAADVTAPMIVTQLLLDATGAHLSGRGEAGATVTVRDAAGNGLGSVIVAADGRFSITLDTVQNNGGSLSVVQTDAAGLVSPTASISAPDLVAPLPATHLVVQPGGLELVGQAEAGATVRVLSADGTPVGHGVVGTDGNLSVVLDIAQHNGQLLSVLIIDAAGNSSPVAPVRAPDDTPPEPVSQLALSTNGGVITGSGEAGAAVQVSVGAQLLGTGVVDANGHFTVTLSPAQLNGQLLNVVQIDAANNASTAVPFQTPDLIAPESPRALVVNPEGDRLAGSGEAGARVEVRGPGGILLGSGTVGGDGTFQVSLTPAQTDGESLVVRLIDRAGNVSVPAQVTAPDTTPPTEPVHVAIDGLGATVSGQGVAGSTVRVSAADGVVLGTAIVAANGSFSVRLTTAQIDNQPLTVVQVDTAGNVSTGVTVVAPDLTPPAQANTLSVSGDGLTLSGHGEPGALVTVRGADGAVIGNGQVSAGGSFSLGLSAAQINGETLSVVLADSHGNRSAAALVTAPDIDANTPVIATDNLASATVNIVPVTSSSSFNDSFSTLISGFSKTFAFTISSGTTADAALTLTTSSALALLNGAVFVLQVQNAAGAWVNIGSSSSGGLLDVLNLNGQAVRVDIDTLAAGNYRLTVSSTGIGVLTTVSTHMDVDSTSLTQFTGIGGGVLRGNLVTDPGVGNSGADQIGPDGLATVRIQKNGVFVDAGTATTVQGQYGQLIIDGNGNYRYTPNGSLASVGKVDTFQYQLTHPNGLQSTATLYVRIDSPQATEIWNDGNLAAPALLVDATNDTASSTLSLAHRVETSSQTLGSYNSAVIGGGSGTWNFSVAADTSANLTVGVNSTGLNVLSPLTITLYQQNASGTYVQIGVYSGTSLVSLGSNTVGVNIAGRAAGNYQVKVATGGLGLAAQVTASLTSTATYANQFVVSNYTPVSGNLITDTAGGVDILGSAFTTLSVLGATGYVMPGYNGTAVAGTYGTLLVQADGSYSYTLNANLTSAAIGHADVFTYRLTHPTGTQDTATLTVDLNAAGGALTSAVAVSEVGVPITVDGHDTSALAVVVPTLGDHVQGSDGNDVLDGSRGGALTFEGHAGNDRIDLYDLDFTRIDGGTGIDTVHWSGGDLKIDLTQLASRIANIEILDLNHGSAVDLTIDLSDVISIIEPGKDRLLVQGDSHDTVHLDGDWVSGNTQTDDGLTYAVYASTEDPSHHLWVQNGVNVV